MKRLTILLLATSLFGDVTPNYPDQTPVWANENDIKVAQTIAGESRCQSLYGQTLVADVIANRMLNTGQTAFEVVIQPNQFVGSNYEGNEISSHIWKLTRKLKLGIDIIPELNHTQFRAWKLTDVPSWAKNPIIVGSHIFFSEP